MPVPAPNLRAVVCTLQEINKSTLRKPQFSDYGRMFAVAAIWGSTFIVNEAALHDFSPIAVATYRIGLAALLLCLICVWRGHRVPMDRRTVSLLVVVGVLTSAVPFSLIGWGQLRIDSATTAILLASSPFFTLLLSHFLTHDDRFSWQKLSGLVCGFAGVVVLLGNGISGGGGSFPGMLAVILAGVCYSISTMLIRRLPDLPSLVLAAGSLFAACLVLIPVLFVLDAPWNQEFSAVSLGAVVYLAVGPTAMAYVLRAQIVKLNGAVFMSNVGYLIPLFAVCWGWLLLSQSPSLVMWLSLALILTGIAVGQRRSKHG